MRTEIVTATGFLEHKFYWSAVEGTTIVLLSFKHRILSENYIGTTLPRQRCLLQKPQLELINEGKRLNVIVRYKCEPNNSCPSFVIEFNWEEKLIE